MYPSSALIFFFYLCFIKRHYVTEKEKCNESIEELNVRPENVTEITFRIKERKEWK
jgi:hypothetical protein